MRIKFLFVFVIMKLIISTNSYTFIKRTIDQDGKYVEKEMTCDDLNAYLNQTTGTFLCFPSKEVEACGLSPSNFCIEKVHSHSKQKYQQRRQDKNSKRQKRSTLIPFIPDEFIHITKMSKDTKFIDQYEDMGPSKYRASYLYSIHLASNKYPYSIGKITNDGCLVFKKFSALTDFEGKDSAFVFKSSTDDEGSTKQFKFERKTYEVPPHIKFYKLVNLKHHKNWLAAEAKMENYGHRVGLISTSNDMDPEGRYHIFWNRFIGHVWWAETQAYANCFFRRIDLNKCPHDRGCTEHNLYDLHRDDHRVIFRPHIVNLGGEMKNIKFKEDINKILSKKIQKVDLATKDIFRNNGPTRIVRRFTASKDLTASRSFTSSWELHASVSISASVEGGILVKSGRVHGESTLSTGGGNTNIVEDTTVETFSVDQEITIPPYTSVEAHGYINVAKGVVVDYEAEVELKGDFARMRLDGTLGEWPATGNDIKTYVMDVIPHTGTLELLNVTQNSIILKTKGQYKADYGVETQIVINRIP